MFFAPFLANHTSADVVDAVFSSVPSTGSHCSRRGRDCWYGRLFTVPSSCLILMLSWSGRLSELRVKTVKYFKSIERVQEEVEQSHAALKANGINN